MNPIPDKSQFVNIQNHTCPSATEKSALNILDREEKEDEQDEDEFEEVSQYFEDRLSDLFFEDEDDSEDRDED